MQKVSVSVMGKDLSGELTCTGTGFVVTSLIAFLDNEALPKLGSSL